MHFSGSNFKDKGQPMIFSNIYIEYSARIAASFFCGLLLGFERKTRQHSVGMRTLILISVSSSLLAMLSSIITLEPRVTGGDPTRVAAGVVTGIGFLGAGAILRQGMNIKGLTSAAIIWTAAALGIACGVGQYFLAGITLAVSLASLIILEKVEFHLFPAEKSKNLTIVYENHDIDIQKVQQEVAEAGLIQRDLNMSESIEKERTVLRFSVKAPGDFKLDELTKKLMKTGKIIKISISDD